VRGKKVGMKWQKMRKKEEREKEREREREMW